MQLLTKHKYQLSEVVSALQKAIRRADARIAGWMAVEMFESGYDRYLWRRLLVISAEDIADPITKEIQALYLAHNEVKESKKKGKCRVFIAKAIILMCRAQKSRDADHLTNLIYDLDAIPADELLAELKKAGPVAIPDYALDFHTQKGRANGKTKRDFFLDEHDALKPRQSGLFDAEVEKMRA